MSDELDDLSLSQLRLYKAHLVDEIKQRQRITRQIDKKIKALLKSCDYDIRRLDA